MTVVPAWGRSERPHPDFNACFSRLFAPAKRVPAAAGPAPNRFELFRRDSNGTDKLPPLRDDLGKRDSIGKEMSGEMRTYDSALVRRVSSLPNPPVPPKLNLPPVPPRPEYVAVGQGSASISQCRGLPQPDRVIIRSLPKGPAFCFVGIFQRQGERQGRASIDGACETFADAAKGFGMVEASLIGGPFMEGLVPDSVSAVVLRYRGHAPIRAHLSENAFWAKVPRLPPSEPGAHALKTSAALRRAVLGGLPQRVVWQTADGQTLRSFSPPRSYVGLLMRRYRACVVTDCGR